MRIVAIVNQKGGCGKTTTAINLAAVLARRGLRTLIVDMDPQSHCAAGLGVPESNIEFSIADALILGRSRPLETSGLLWEVSANLDLAPSTIRLAGLEAPQGGLHELPDKDRRLSLVLDQFRDRYDYCLIDCPPTLGLLTFNALRAAREALIPVETGFFAFRGAEKQWGTIRRLIDRLGRPINCHIVPTLYDETSQLARDILASLRQQFAEHVAPAIIRQDQALREAASFGQPVIEFAPESNASRDYQALADWLESNPPRREASVEVTQP
ncbi:MAG: ParA family protein, partial [Phycisphaerales bacterium]|nr:ParA family protein [Phycisphaerales bacterium]